MSPMSHEGDGPEAPPRSAAPDPAEEPPPAAFPANPERPATVKAAAIILYISAALLVLAVCALNVAAADGGEEADEFAGLLLIVSAFFAGAAVLNAVLGYFIWQGRNWARILGMVLAGLAVLSGGIDVLDGRAASSVSVVLNLVVIGLLAAPSAGEYFRRRAG